MRIAHISDFHLPAKRGKRVNGVDPHANLDRAVDTLKAQKPKADIIIIGGDLLDEGDKGSYEGIAELFKELQVPVLAVAGNHDHLGSLLKSSLSPSTESTKGYYSVDENKVHFIVLASARTGKPHGLLDEEQLLWLSRDLYESRSKPVLIFLHHPPFDTGIAWLDKIKLLNADAFWDIIPPYSKNVLGVFAAHVHVQISFQFRGLLAATSPAVCWQYSGNADATKAEISDELPGFNLIDLEDSQIRIRTVRFIAAPEQPAGQ